ncbi:MAG: hypothetical protein ACJAUM_002024 [Pseudomonadales bacterium]|jgi:hypothetical protein
MFVQSDYAVNPMAGKVLMQNIKSQLETKGYRYVEDRTAADVAVIFSIGARDKVEYANQQNLFPENARWGGEFADETLMEPRQTQYVEGILAIDVFDIQKKHLYGMVLRVRNIKKYTARRRC